MPQIDTLKKACLPQNEGRIEKSTVLPESWHVKIKSKTYGIIQKKLVPSRLSDIKMSWVVGYKCLTSLSEIKQKIFVFVGIILFKESSNAL